MALQFSTALRNAHADRIESYVGASAIMKIRSGSVPANCAAADSGTVLATLNLPADWMNDASAGAVTLKGTWQDTSCDATGTAGHFRIYRSDGTTCELQEPSLPREAAATSRAARLRSSRAVRSRSPASP
jgi:hypothetical protein